LTRAGRFLLRGQAADELAALRAVPAIDPAAALVKVLPHQQNPLMRCQN
jgi:hypothetical protein